MKWRAAAAVVLASTVLSGTALVARAGAPAGSSGLGDPFFPLAGNGGYEVGNYDVRFSFDPAKGAIDATTVITAHATQNLAQFDLDLRGFDVSAVLVNGRRATFTRQGQELVVTIGSTVHPGGALNVQVDYRGVPAPVIDPDGSSEGWMTTKGGGIIALGEPQGSPAWFPANDYPTDKATFALTVTVPQGLNVVSNGLPDGPVQQAKTTTYRWHEDTPMATYLATVAIGKFDVTTSRTASGLPVINAIASSLANKSAASVARIPEMIDWLQTIFGPYPFTSTGAIVVDAPSVGYALETQDRPVFTFAPDDFTMVHELAHQWVGDSVSLSTWPDIWLNEGFAGYVEWLWSEHDGGSSAEAIFQYLYNRFPANDPFWTVPPDALPDATELFGDAVYARGAMTLHELRKTVGDAAFFTILRTWTTQNRDGNVTTAQFIALAEQISGQDLTAFFNAWLDTPSKPAAV